MNDYKSKKVKRTIFVVLSVLILFISMLYSLCYVAIDYGKGTAVLYFFIWIWAINYVCDNKEFTSVKSENDRLKEDVDFYKNMAKRFELELKELKEKV